jgi:carboxy-terminal domain RNA polymerase II polypeptide A small phosphatase
VRRYDPERFEEYHVKDLKKIKRMGYRLERVLIADDTPGKVERHYGNAVYVPPFFGDPDDETLPRLARFLFSLRDVPNVRTLEKRGWSRDAQ